MDIPEFLDRLERSIALYDLIRHPFYQEWSRGELRSEDLQEYAKDYYHHVESFPRCLLQFARRLGTSELRQVVLTNLSNAVGSTVRRSHAAFWLDFAEGVGAGRTLRDDQPSSHIRTLVAFFQRIAKEGTAEEVLAAFYAYESQVPRVSRENWRALQEKYGANDRTCGYFILRATADVHHSWAWRTQLEKRLRANPEGSETALKSAQSTVRILWDTLDGIEGACLARIPASARTASKAGKLGLTSQLLRKFEDSTSPEVI
jgi:pyrroloquinoline-quinone synthase